MDRYIIEGGKPLKGKISVHGAKNAALPVMAASVLSPGLSVLDNVPLLSDVRAMAEILETLGAQVARLGVHQLAVDASGICNAEVPEDLMRRMRSSFIVVGPLLARLGRVKVTYPGGCAIGTRAIDLHLKGLASLGVRVQERKSGHIEFVARDLRGAMIYLDYPSVGATQNIMMAAITARGTTVISNPAREPEIVDLQNFLNKLGAQISGAGSDHIVIHGVDRESLHPARHAIIPDRIVAGTLLLAGAATRGDVTVDGLIPGHLSVLTAKLTEMGAEVVVGEREIRVKASRQLQAVDHIRTAPYPGFPTDLQPQVTAVLTTAAGVSVVTEKIFDGRFKHIDELRRMGANISIDDRTAIIRGVDSLTGARVEASDLRAGAALVIAALMAEGSSIVDGVHHIERGYQRFDQQLAQLGAVISREKGDLSLA